MIANRRGPSMSAFRTLLDKGNAREEILLHETTIVSLFIRRARWHGRARPGR